MKKSYKVWVVCNHYGFFPAVHFSKFEAELDSADLGLIFPATLTLAPEKKKTPSKAPKKNPKTKR